MDGEFQQFWHEADKGEAHTAVFEHVNAVEQQQRHLHEANIAHAQLYANREEPGLGASSYVGYRDSYLGVTENVIQSVVDTATSLIGKSKPKVSFLTEGGNWDLQNLAKQLEQFCLGLFQHLRIYDLMPLIFRDACVFGTGCLFFYEDGDSVGVERVLVDDIVVDEGECPSGNKPRQLHRFKPVSKAVLSAKYPELSALIEKSSGKRSNRPGLEWRQVDPQMALCVESWYLPIGNQPGRHTICLEEATLHDEEYKEDYFPFVFYHWQPPLTGWYGQGLAESLLGFQVRINDLNDFIQKCQDLIAVPRVFVDASVRQLHAEIDDTIGAIIPYIGKPPTFFSPQAVSGEIYAYKESLKAAAFEFAGISKMAAQATRPEGIEAAVALRELSDNQSQRFSIQQARYEEAYMDAGRQCVSIMRKIQAKRKKPKSRALGHFVELVDWPSADLDMHKFSMRAMPSSILGETPSGKLQRIVEFAQYGVQFDQAELRRLLDQPDLKLADARAISALEHTEWMIGQWAKGEYVQPDAFMDLPQILQRGTAGLLDAQRQGAPEDILEVFRQGLLEAQRLIELAAPPQPDPAMGVGGELPDGAVAETGLPGVVDPTVDDTGETLMPGLTGTF